MKNIRVFLSENFHFLVVKFSVYLNRRVFVMRRLVRRNTYVQTGSYICDFPFEMTEFYPFFLRINTVVCLLRIILCSLRYCQ